MSFEFKEGQFWVGFWFLDIPQTIRRGDLMGGVWREADDPPEHWRFLYRFRWYVDEKVFDSADEKSWYGGHGGPIPLEGIESQFTMLFEKAAAVAGGTKAKYYPVLGDIRKALAVLETCPWISMRTMPIEPERSDP